MSVAGPQGPAQQSRLRKATSPVHWPSDEEPPQIDEDGIALCLSGGGFRAMLFHLGALWRLNELRYLGRLTRVSSVSGGSITAAVLGSNWDQLEFEDGFARGFEEALVRPLRDLAGKTLDVRAGLAGLLTPGRSISSALAGAYDRHLFHGASTAELGRGDPAAPLFVLDSTNLQTGSLWRFTQRGTWDYRVGAREEPARLATAVAASSAFPPILGPATVRTAPGEFDTTAAAPAFPGIPGLDREDFMRRPTLVDGGVYDNLGLEPAWKNCRTVLISDAGGAFAPQTGRFWLLPWWRWRDWGTQTMRVLKTIDNQVRSLRKHQAIAGFEALLDSAEHRRGTYWGIRGHVADYPLPSALSFPAETAREAALVRTRLARLSPQCRADLIDWGYVICDTAMRAWVVEGAERPPLLPSQQPPAS